MSEAPVGAPRATVEPDAMARIMGLLKGVQRQLDEFVRTSTLRNASASGGEGFSIITEEGARRLQLLPEPGCLVAYDENEEPVLRLGTMVETGDLPDSDPYGIEVRVNGVWIQLGTQSVEWGNVGGKPEQFPPSPHSHEGGDITSKVASAAQADSATSANSAGTASQATNAARADRADGVTAEAFAREVGGIPGSFYAMWMHSNGQMGRNTSSIKYKRNVRDHAMDPAKVLQLRPVMYDRKVANGDDNTPPATVNEFGLIAEEVQQVAPELVVYYGGEIDSVRYDLVALAVLALSKAQQQRIEALELKQQEHSKTIGALVKALGTLGIRI